MIGDPQRRCCYLSLNPNNLEPNKVNPLVVEFGARPSFEVSYARKVGSFLLSHLMGRE